MRRERKVRSIWTWNDSGHGSYKSFSILKFVREVLLRTERLAEQPSYDQKTCYALCCIYLPLPNAFICLLSPESQTYHWTPPLDREFRPLVPNEAPNVLSWKASSIEPFPPFLVLTSRSAATMLMCWMRRRASRSYSRAVLRASFWRVARGAEGTDVRTYSC